MVHHTRKAETTDYVDSISGTYGLPAAADYLLVLKRKRQARDAILQVTGRDVDEAEYALGTDNGLWTLCGDDLREAANEAETRQLTAGLGERALEVLTLVNTRDGETTARDVNEELGISKDQASVYLNRLVERGRIRKLSRGKFVPNNIPVISVGSVGNIEHSLHNKQGYLRGARENERGNDEPTQADMFAEPRHPPPTSKTTLLVTGPGRCTDCGWHTDTQGHAPDCPDNKPEPPW
jgi:hypothetical protein